MTRPAPSRRDAYFYFTAITTRWGDNDAYGHVNNTIYHAWFDTAVNRFLIEHGLLDVVDSQVIGVVAENGCRYYEQIAYPDDVTVGLRVEHLGRSSVRYAIGVFRGGQSVASADGHLVHVYVDRVSMRPVPIPDASRVEMARIQPPPQAT
jgi:acyl-CoA thioester hydrolase